MTQNALFPYFSELFLVFLLKHPSEQYRLPQWVIVWNFQPKKFFLWVGAPRWSRNSPNYPKIAFLLRFTPICWDIFHKLPLNSILISIRISLKLFFEKNASGWVMGPKMTQNALFSYSSELFFVFLLKHPSKQGRPSQWVTDPVDI